MQRYDSYHQNQHQRQNTNHNQVQYTKCFQIQKQTCINQVVQQNYTQKIMAPQRPIYFLQQQPMTNSIFLHQHDSIIQNSNFTGTRLIQNQQLFMSQNTSKATERTQQTLSNDSPPDFSSTNHTRNNSRSKSPQKSPESPFKLWSNQAFPFKQQNQSIETQLHAQGNSYLLSPPDDMHAKQVSNSLKNSDNYTKKLLSETFHESFSLQKNIPVSSSEGYSLPQRGQTKFEAKINSLNNIQKSSNQINSDPTITKRQKIFQNQPRQENYLNLTQAYGFGKNDLTMDQIHRRKSVIHMEMQNNNNKNILLEELQTSLKEDDIEDEKNLERMVYLQNIKLRISDQSAEILAKAKLFQVLVNSVTQEREFQIDITQIPQQWRLKELASILNNIYSEQMGDDQFKLKSPIISLLVGRVHTFRLEQRMKISELIDMALSGLMGKDNLIVLEEYTVQ